MLPLQGSLLWLSQNTRSDIKLPVHLMAQFCGCPLPVHFQLLLDILGYLWGTSEYGLVYVNPSNPSYHSFYGGFRAEWGIPDVWRDVLTSFSDSDWANCSESRRSRGAYMFFFMGALTSCRTMMLGRDVPGRVCHSSFDAEVRTLSEQDKENRFQRWLLAGLMRPMVGPTLTGVDNKGSVDMAYSREVGSRSRHIEISLFSVRESVKLNENRPYHISGKLNPADWLTKIHDQAGFLRGRDLIMGSQLAQDYFSKRELVVPVVVRAACVPRVPESCRIVIRRLVSNIRFKQVMDDSIVGNVDGGSAILPRAEVGEAAEPQPDTVLPQAGAGEAAEPQPVIERSNREMWWDWEPSEDESGEDLPGMEVSSDVDSSGGSGDEGEDLGVSVHVDDLDLVVGGSPAGATEGLVKPGGVLSSGLGATGPTYVAKYTAKNAMNFRLVGAVCDARGLFEEFFHMVMEYLVPPCTLESLWRDLHNLLSPVSAKAVYEYSGFLKFVLGDRPEEAIPQQEPLIVLMVRTPEVGGGSSAVVPVGPGQSGDTSSHQPLASEQLGTTSVQQPLASEQLGTTSVQQPLASERLGTASVQPPLDAGRLRPTSVHLQLASELLGPTSVHPQLASELPGPTSVQVLLTSEHLGSTSVPLPVALAPLMSTSVHGDVGPESAAQELGGSPRVLRSSLSTSGRHHRGVHVGWVQGLSEALDLPHVPAPGAGASPRLTRSAAISAQAGGEFQGSPIYPLTPGSPAIDLLELRGRLLRNRL